MAAPDPLKALRGVDGELIVDPTDLLAPPDFGGTRIGLVMGAAWVRTQVVVPNTAEERGGAVVDWLLRHEAVALTFALRSNDDDARQIHFPNTRADAITGRRVVFGGALGNSSVSHGAWLTETMTHVLLFAPRDSVNHDAVLFPLAIPKQVDDDEGDLTLNGEHLTAVRWIALPARNRIPYEVGPLESLSGLASVAGGGFSSGFTTGFGGP